MTVCVSTDPMRDRASQPRLVSERAAARVLPAPASPPSASPATGVGPLDTEAERDALFVELQPLIRRLIHRYGKDAEQREDLQGEMYPRFCELLAGYDPKRGVPLRPYLVRMLTLAAYTHARTDWRRRNREVRLEHPGGAVAVGSASDPSEDWIEQIIAAELMDLLPAAIARLPRRQREVVVWRYYQLKSFDEIAELLRVRPATVRSLLRHALQSLRNGLTAPEPVTDPPG